MSQNRLGKKKKCKDNQRKIRKFRIALLFFVIFVLLQLLNKAKVEVVIMYCMFRE